MRKIQEIFDAVIAAGMYSEEYSPYMCLSLGAAYNRGVISKKEYDKGIKSINVFIRGLPQYHNSRDTLPLACYLRALKGDFVEVAPFSECLAVYKNWEKRPRWHRKMRPLPM